MDIVQLIVIVVVFAIVVYGLDWACSRFAMPTPVKWLVGALIIIILLLFLLRVTGIYAVGSGAVHTPLLK